MLVSYDVEVRSGLNKRREENICVGAGSGRKSFKKRTPRARTMAEINPRSWTVREYINKKRRRERARKRKKYICDDATTFNVPMLRGIRAEASAEQDFNRTGKYRKKKFEFIVIDTDCCTTLCVCLQQTQTGEHSACLQMRKPMRIFCADGCTKSAYSKRFCALPTLSCRARRLEKIITKWEIRSMHSNAIRCSTKL